MAGGHSCPASGGAELMVGPVVVAKEEKSGPFERVNSRHAIDKCGYYIYAQL